MHRDFLITLYYKPILNNAAMFQVVQGYLWTQQRQSNFALYITLKTASYRYQTTRLEEIKGTGKARHRTGHEYPEGGTGIALLFL
jgi:hypothetical protein